MSATLSSYVSRVQDSVDMLLCHWWPYRPLKVSKVDLSGKNAIVTGANCGIGLECARKLAAFGASVTLACRSAEKGEEARRDIELSTGSNKVDVRVLNLSSFESVREFVKAWGGKPLDILMNNAGMTPGRYFKTADGVEESYQVNHLSAFLLTSLLLPVFAPHTRIVNTSSYLHFSGTLDPNDVDRSSFCDKKLERHPNVTDSFKRDQLVTPGRYDDAKLSQVAFARELQVRLDASTAYASKKIIVSSCHPGVVTSNIFGRHLGTSERLDKAINRQLFVVGLLGISTEQGACTQTWLATDPALSVSGGLYYNRCRVSAPNPLVEDAALRQKLWVAWSAKCGIPPDI